MLTYLLCAASALPARSYEHLHVLRIISIRIPVPKYTSYYINTSTGVKVQPNNTIELIPIACRKYSTPVHLPVEPLHAGIPRWCKQISHLPTFKYSIQLRARPYPPGFKSYHTVDQPRPLFPSKHKSPQQILRTIRGGIDGTPSLQIKRKHVHGSQEDVVGAPTGCCCCCGYLCV